jgi:streptogramin lyase
LPLGSYALTLEGTLSAGGNTYCFTLQTKLSVPPASSGSAAPTAWIASVNQVTGGKFPAQTPDFDDEVNQAGWTVPTAPFQPGPPPPGETSVAAVPSASPAGSVFPTNGGLGLKSGPMTASGDSPPVEFTMNNSLGLSSAGSNCGLDLAAVCAEPSGASGGGVVFVSTNCRVSTESKVRCDSGTDRLGAAYSTDGVNFTHLDPTMIFPDDAVGFCCDQIVQYVPSIDRFVWLLQGNDSPPHQGGYRLATASPAAIIASGGTAWTYWNLTPNWFGSCTRLDYPDMSVGNNDLYISWDAYSGCTSGFQVARTSLAGLRAGGPISGEATHPADAPMVWLSHVTQNTGDEVFWAGHNNNKNIRVFSWAEGASSYSWRDVGISSWANNPLSSTTPDGKNWLARGSDNGIIGATRSGDQLWFAWNAGTDGTFTQPHIEMVRLDKSDFHKIQQVQIWSSSLAFGYPALATNSCTGEIGLSFESGGGGNYENHVVGFWGDFKVYVTTASDVGTTRFGDYVTIRQAPPTADNPGNLFDAFGYGVNSVPPPDADTQADVHYVSFGRSASSCVAGPTISEYLIPTADSAPRGITPGPDGSLWFTEGIGKIGRITTSGTFTEYALPTAESAPSEITSGPDGALWFTEYGSNRIGRITTSGAITEYTISDLLGRPYGITVGPDGALWFTGIDAGKIGRITTSGAVSEYAIPDRYSYPWGIAAGPDGALWFTEFGFPEGAGNKIGRITTSGAITEYPIPSADSAPTGITSGPDGALWFTELSGNIGRITTSGAISEYALPYPADPLDIASGPDGALWFADYGGKIGRITTGGAISEYTLPTWGSRDIVTGPDGALWFTEEISNKIGRITTG